MHAGSMIERDLGGVDDSAQTYHPPPSSNRSKPTSLQGNDEDSSSTLTGSFGQDWKKTRSLFNVSFDPDEVYPSKRQDFKYLTLCLAFL